MTAPVDVAPAHRRRPGPPSAPDLGTAGTRLLRDRLTRCDGVAGVGEPGGGGRGHPGGPQPAASLAAAGQHDHGGGDTGAHVILPAFMKSHLLTHGQLTGWDPDWYDGFPLYTFYFPLPGLITVLFNAVVPYNVAFKLVTVLGTPHPAGVRLGVRSPGRAARPGSGLPGRRHAALPLRAELHHLRREHPVHPGRRVLVLAQPLVRPPVPRAWSPLGLRTGRYRALAAVLFAVTLLCHLLPALFAAAGAGGAGCSSTPTWSAALHRGRGRARPAGGGRDA